MWKIKLRLKSNTGKWTEVFFYDAKKVVEAVKALLNLSETREPLKGAEIVGFSGECAESVAEANGKRYDRIAKKRRVK